jgi:sterol desaturase/sphingolipid hydroxylase (fatty acid hydroxylase superfamily)
VHHAINEAYIDKNYGGILIIWDRLFGTFQDELDELPCVYGTKEPLRSWNPWTANTTVYLGLWRKMRAARGWRDKLAAWFASAGWQPEAGLLPAPAFNEDRDLASRQRYDPKPGAARLALAAALFLMLLGATAAFLWWAHRLGPLGWLGATLAMTLGLAGVAKLCEPAPFHC